MATARQCYRWTLATGGVLLLCLLALPAASATEPVEPGPRPGLMSENPQDQARFREALEAHQEGVGGDEAAVRRAQDLLEELQRAHPGDARVRAFLGNTYVLRARDAVLFRKMKWLRQGVDLLDEAVAAAPDDPHVRSVRAVNSYQLPALFGRSGIAREDFATLLAWTRDHPERFTPDLLRFVYYHAGQFYEGEDDYQSAQLYELALSTDSDSVSDEQIRGALSAVQ